MRDAIENVVGGLVLFAVIVFTSFEVQSYRRKYRLNANDSNALFFFLMYGSDAGKLLLTQPAMMRKEFPETVAAIESYRLRTA